MYSFNDYFQLLCDIVFFRPSSAFKCLLSLNMVCLLLVSPDGDSFEESNDLLLKLSSTLLPGAGKPGEGAPLPVQWSQPEQKVTRNAAGTQHPDL